MDVKFEHTGLEIAVIGMACRFPGASDPEAFYQNLLHGFHSNRPLNEEEKKRSASYADLSANPAFVDSLSVLEGKDRFDNAFFGYTPDEAAMMNPEHRLFHECVWEALEDAGYDPDQYDGMIGLYAGGGLDFNWKLFTTIANSKYELNDFYLNRINNKDYLTSLISYKLNLTGPSYAIQSACSTSLVSVHTACRALLLGETKLALAGGVSINTKKSGGFVHSEGMIHSTDGYCRAFDKDSSGTFDSEGAGVIVLKRLKDAIADGDQIHAVIKGSAINNDGNRKVGYTAPSVEGQAECIRTAQKFARIAPETIGYVEAHGTATRLGDPIEIEALNIAFDQQTDKTCSVGSVKSNIGHLNTAAGIAGLIKTVLCLKHKKIPASLFYTEPNPAIDFANGPFYVNNDLRDWERTSEIPLRAAVSSFGIGGTNAHVILEESPVVQQNQSSEQLNLLTLSAKTEHSLNTYITKLRTFLIEHPDTNVSDLCYSLQKGRKGFAFRKAVLLTGNKPDYSASLTQLTKLQPAFASTKKVCFMFPGAGSQYPGMTKDLYEQHPVFKEEMDRGFDILLRLTGFNYNSIIYPDAADDKQINEMLHTQPALFLVEYAMARLLMHYGVTPDVTIGHSVGEYVAACVGGVFSFEDALKLVVSRGELMQSLSGGAMVSVAISEAEAKIYTHSRISIAAVNGPEQVVLSGDTEAIEEIIPVLQKNEEQFVRLYATQAGHSPMMEDIREAYRKVLDGITKNAPVIPYVSNVTGKLITPEQAISTEYWLDHLRNTVRFSDGITTLMQSGECLFIESGPGHALCSLLRQNDFGNAGHVMLNAIRPIKEQANDYEFFIEQLGQLWSHGVSIDFDRLYSERRSRVSLPAYAFEHQSFPTEVDIFEDGMLEGIGMGNSLSSQGTELKDWLYFPVWKQEAEILLLPEAQHSRKVILFFTGDDAFSGQAMKRFATTGHTVVCVNRAQAFARLDEQTFSVNPTQPESLVSLAEALNQTGYAFTDILYGWSLDTAGKELLLSENNTSMQRLYFDLAAILGKLDQLKTAAHPVVSILTCKAHKVMATDTVDYDQSVVLGMNNVIPQEYRIASRNIDADSWNEATAEVVSTILAGDNREGILALRNGEIWVREFQRNTLPVTESATAVKKEGTYLITGGLGQVGQIIARGLLENYNANVIVLGRKKLPDNFNASLPQNESWLSRLAALQQVGNISYEQADVTDLGSLTTAVDAIRSRFGKIDGVIHAAGNVQFSDYEFIADTTPEKTARVMDAKVNGTRHLYELFKDDSPDFVWMTSSLASVIAGLSFTAYSSANLFMEHFLYSGLPGLENWKCVGLSEMLFDEERIRQEMNSRQRSALVPGEIFALFEWSTGLKRVRYIAETVVDLQARIERAFSLEEEQKNSEVAEAQITKRSRAHLKNTFVAPETDTEKQFALLLEEFFGIAEIGLEDSFFELGGDSLKAMVLLKRIKRDFDVSIPLKDFFGLVTVQSIAAEIDNVRWLRSEVTLKNEITI